MSANIHTSQQGHAHLALTARAWHGLGTILGRPFTLAEGLASARLGRELYPVTREAVYVLRGGQTYAAPGQSLSRAGGTPFAVVGPSYVEIQDDDAFASLPRAMGRDSGDAVYESMGALGDSGDTVFASSIVLDAPRVRDTTLDMRYTVISGHGTSSAILACTATLAVCANTVAVVRSAARTHGEVGEERLVSRVRHTRGGQARLDRAATSEAARVAEVRALAAALDAAGGVTLGATEAREVVSHLYPSVNDKGETTPSASKAQARILELNDGGERAGLVGAEVWGRGTALSLYAAITQYLDRESTMRAGNMTGSQVGASRYLRSSLGLDAGINRVRAEAGRVLLGVGV